MKRHLLTLLFFFLLLDSSLSITDASGIGKLVDFIGENVKNKGKALFSGSSAKKASHEVLDSAFDFGSNNINDLAGSIPQPGASPKKIIHGLDHQTRQQHLPFHCGVEDYNFSPTYPFSWPKGKNWFSNRPILTYGFDRQIQENFVLVFRESFNRWSQELSLTLKEATYDNADIKIGFHSFNNNMVVGESLIQLPSKYGDATLGYILLDANKNWGILNDSPELNRATPVDNGMIDIGTVAMHQIGHLLGLSHSPYIDSVMSPYILPGKQRVQFSNSDIQQIKQVYSPNGNGNGVGSSP